MNDWENGGFFRLAGQGLALVMGPDRLEWLQGQITNDIRLLTPERALPFAFCTPTGQFVTDAIAVDLGDRTLLTTPAGVAGPLIAHLNDLIIMEEVELAEADGWAVTVQGGSAEEAVRRACGVEPPTEPYGVVRAGEVIVMKNDRTGLDGWDLLSLSGGADAVIEKLSLPEIPEDGFETLRIRAGLPKRGAEITDKVLPPELGPEFDREYIHYSKGCYTGQEVLQRIHSRGHTNRVLVCLRLAAAAEAGAKLEREDHPSPGVVTSVAPLPEQDGRWAALALVRHEFSQPDEWFVLNGARAEVVPSSRHEKGRGNHGPLANGSDQSIH